MRYNYRASKFPSDTQRHMFSFAQTVDLYMNLVNQGEVRENSTPEVPKLRKRDKD